MKLKHALIGLSISLLASTAANAWDNQTLVANNATWQRVAALVARIPGEVFKKTCFTKAEEPYCQSMAYAPVNDGTEFGAVVLFEYYDLDGKIFKRDMCLGHKYADIRICTDWDTGVSRKQALDHDTDAWELVGTNSAPDLNRTVVINRLRDLAR